MHLTMGIAMPSGISPHFRGPLKLESVSRLFPQTRGPQAGVRNLSLEIQPGEGLSLLGPSGCGKTTTLRLLGGFERPEKGRIFHGTEDITLLPPQKRNIRTVFQRYALFPHMSVYENVVFSLRMKKWPEEDIRKKADVILELIEISHLLERSVAQLSGGEQQRVALARALISEPEVLLLDEPFSALDLKLRERMQSELLALRKKIGTTFLFVTHDQGEAMFLSDRIGIMNCGQLEQIGSPQDIYHRPRTRFVAAFVGQANFLGTELIPHLQGAHAQLPGLPHDGSRVWMVRPEHLVARPNTEPLPDGWVALPSRLADSNFTGQDQMFRFFDPLGGELLMRRPNYEAPLTLQHPYLVSWKAAQTWTVENAVSP